MEIFSPVALRTAAKVLIVGLPRADKVRYSVSRDSCVWAANAVMPQRASTTLRKAAKYVWGSPSSLAAFTPGYSTYPRPSNRKTYSRFDGQSA